MSPIHEYHLTVPEEAIDGNGHANNVEYLRWMSDAAKSHASACGGSEAAKQLGAAWVVRSHWIEYLRPLVAGERVMVRTWVQDFERVTSLRQYRFSSGEQAVARAETKWVLIDLASGRLRPIPIELQSCFGTAPTVDEPQVKSA